MNTHDDAFDDEALRRLLRRHADQDDTTVELADRVGGRLELIEPHAAARRLPLARPVLVAASVIIAVGTLVVGLVAVDRSDETANVGVASTLPAVETPSDSDADPAPVRIRPLSGAESVPDGARRIVSTDLRVPLQFDVPIDLPITVIAESSAVLEVSLAGPTDVSPPSVPILRLIAPDQGDSIEDLVASLRQPHVDTLVVVVEPSQIGGIESTVVRMASDRGSTAVGFEVGSSVSIGADGIDRVYAVHVLAAEDGPIVAWIDAPRSEFAAVHDEVDRLLASLRVGGR